MTQDLQGSGHSREGAGGGPPNSSPAPASATPSKPNVSRSLAQLRAGADLRGPSQSQESPRPKVSPACKARREQRVWAAGKGQGGSQDRERPPLMAAGGRLLLPTK